MSDIDIQIGIGLMTDYTIKSNFLQVLSDRKFIHGISNVEGLDNLLYSETVSAYIGFDCTAPSLHVGSLMQIMLLYWLQQCGHRPIILMGSGTSQVGDPSGKTDTRQLLSPDTIEQNKKGIRKVFRRVLTIGSGPTGAKIVDNSKWLSDLNYLEFIRNIGRFFSVNQMLQRDAVKQRLERKQNLSFLEFNYMILQAFDFAVLNRRYGVRLQMGGSDQFGNIASGIDLGRRLNNNIELYGLTTPLLETSSGVKMGKTAEGAIWLDPKLYSAYNYWQYWRNTADQNVDQFLRLFTTLPLQSIKSLAREDINYAKIVLATEATKFIHGIDAANQAAETSRNIFEQNAMPISVTTIKAVRVNQQLLKNGIEISKLFVIANLCRSNSEARKYIRSGAIRINNEKLFDEHYLVNWDDLNEKKMIKLSLGKKKHVFVKPSYHKS